MKYYKYKAKKSPRETVEGVLSAATRESAVSQINDLGLLPIDIHEVKTAAGVHTVKTEHSAQEGQKVSSLNSVRLKPRDLVMFYRQWGRMLRAGIPILKTLDILLEQTEAARVKAVITRIRDDVKQGHSVSASARKFPKAFLDFDVALIQAGESVGKLHETLLELARYRENQLTFNSKLRSAIAYPAFVFLVGTGTVYYMLANVIPQFSLFFQDLGQELPLATRMLIAVSGQFHLYGLPGLIAAAAACILIRASLKIQKNRLTWHRFILGLPWIGRVAAKAEIARMTRTLELLLGNGLSLMRALQAVIPVCKNELFRQNLKDCLKRVEEGGIFSEGLTQSRLYPSMVIYLIRTAEESGNLREAVSEIAEWYESEVQDSLQMATKMIEPIFILLIGLVLGAIVVALLLPVFSMSAAIN